MLRRTPLRRSGPPRRTIRATGPDAATRAAVAERDRGCVMCGSRSRDLQLHHRLPRKMGGRSGKEEINSPVNLLTLCLEDHLWVERRREEAYDSGWLVRESDDPAGIPVDHALHGLVFLRADGSVMQVPPLDGAA